MEKETSAAILVKVTAAVSSSASKKPVDVSLRPVYHNNSQIVEQQTNVLFKKH